MITGVQFDQLVPLWAGLRVTLLRGQGSDCGHFCASNRLMGYAYRSTTLLDVQNALENAGIGFVGTLDEGPRRTPLARRIANRAPWETTRPAAERTAYKPKSCGIGLESVAQSACRRSRELLARHPMGRQLAEFAPSSGRAADGAPAPLRLWSRGQNGGKIPLASPQRAITPLVEHANVQKSGGPPNVRGNRRTYPTKSSGASHLGNVQTQIGLIRWSLSN